jgi:N-acetylneuraminic acid mutarotase
LNKNNQPYEKIRGFKSVINKCIHYRVMEFLIRKKGVFRTINTLAIKIFIVILLFNFWNIRDVFSQPIKSKKPDVFGNVWTFKKLKRDAFLPSGKWKSFASDTYGFLWVGGKSGLIRFDPRKPENGWKFFEGNNEYKGGTVRNLNISGNGLMRVTLKTGEVYEVDMDSKGQQITIKIEKNDHPEFPSAWKALSPMPYSAHDVFGAELNGKIYIPGGQAPHGFPAAMKTFNRMFIYDTKKDTWQLSSPMKITRRYCSVGILDDKIWVVGGYIIDGNDQATNTVEIYDPVTDSWTDGPMLNVPCVQAVAAVVKGRLYVMFSNKERTINYTTSIAPGEIIWRSDPPPPYPIFQTDGCELDNKIYLIVPAVGLIMYDPASQTWQTDFPKIPQTQAPRAAAVVNNKNQVWVISGTDVEDEKMVWCFSPKEREWIQGPSVPKSIRWADGIEVNGKLYVFGGATYSERHEIFVFWNTIYMLNELN